MVRIDDAVSKNENAMKGKYLIELKKYSEPILLTKSYIMQMICSIHLFFG